jgi:hypothetical protein
MGATLTMLQAGDSLLFCGERLARNQQSPGLYNFNVLSYLPAGMDAPGGKVWRWMEQIGKKSPMPHPGG